MKNRAVLVIGNGESRSNLNLISYQNHLDMIGCNAIHRDITVNHLVCCDKRMVEEVLLNRNIKSIYTRERYWRDYKKIKKIPLVKLLPEVPLVSDQKVDQPDHWGSGPYAILLAATLEYETIFLVGFDLYGENHFINNVYKSTRNYKDSNTRAVDYSFWIQQIKIIFQKYQDKKFVIFNHLKWSMPDRWKLSNVKFRDIEKFHDTIDFHLNTTYN